MKKARIHLSSNSGETFFFDVVPRAAAISDKWLTALQNCLKEKLELEKNFGWLGFPDSPRQLPELCKALNTCAGRINAYAGWKEPYRISEKFTPELIFHGEVLNHDLMNRLHHHFEILQGQVWNVSPWFTAADHETRFAIRQLNNLCHEIESLVKAIRMRKTHPDYVKPSTLITFLNAPRFDLAEEDYDHFTLDRGGPGKVFMRYCQTGKIHYEAFMDGDTHIGAGNISPLRYYSGEFNIAWGPPEANLPHIVREKARYREWLVQNGFDPEDKKLGHGWLEIGRVDLSAFYDRLPDRKTLTLQKFLSNYLNVTRMEVLEDEVVLAFCDYPARLEDGDYFEKQKAKLAQND